MLSLPTQRQFVAEHGGMSVGWNVTPECAIHFSGVLKFCGLNQSVFSVESSPPAFTKVCFFDDNFIVLGCFMSFRRWLLEVLDTDNADMLRSCSKYPAIKNTELITFSAHDLNMLAGGTDRLDPADNRQGGSRLLSFILCLFSSVLQLHLDVLEIPGPHNIGIFRWK